MPNRYIPHTEEDIRLMLGKIGVESIDDLYSDIPENVIFKGEYDIPAAMSEIEIGSISTIWHPKTQVLRFLPEEASTTTIHPRW